MKILHINCNYVTSPFHKNLILFLSDLGVKNNVFVPVWDSKMVYSENGVIVKQCFNRYDRLFFFYKQRKIQKALKNEFNAGEFDVIHAYTLFTDGNVAYNISKETGKPFVVAVRNTDVNLFLKRFKHLRKLGISILGQAEAIFFLSPCYRDLVINKYVPRELKDKIQKKSYVIPNGIDNFWLKNKNMKGGLSPEKNKENQLSALYVGTIDKNKNILLTVRALKLLTEKGWNVKFTIIGNIRSKKVFKKITDFDFCEYINPLSKENLVEYYRSADIFIMPSHTETFGLVYAEAMSQALPVIYTKGQGFDRQFEEGLVGYHVRDVSANDIINAIELIKNNYKTIQANCLSLVNKFDWKDIAEKYKNIYEKIRRK